MKIRRIRQFIHYSWKHAAWVSNEYYGGKKKIPVLFDIVRCFCKYSMWSNQYVVNKMFAIDSVERERIGSQLLERNKKRDEWVQSFIDNRRFLAKYSTFERETSLEKHNQRGDAYAKQYHTGNGLFVEYGVMIMTQHYINGNLVIKNNVLIGRNADIDYTGDLIVGNGVSISEGVKILTHRHDLESQFVTGGDKKTEADIFHGCTQTPLEIEDFVWIGARATIMPGTTQIGRGAVISANTVVSQKIPPYAIVQGFPAKIVGFRFTPEVAAEFERNNYPEEERIPIEILKENYTKYFNKERRKEIRQFLKM